MKNTLKVISLICGLLLLRAFAYGQTPPRAPSDMDPFMTRERPITEVEAEVQAEHAAIHKAAQRPASPSGTCLRASAAARALRYGSVHDARTADHRNGGGDKSQTGDQIRRKRPPGEHRSR